MGRVTKSKLCVDYGAVAPLLSENVLLPCREALYVMKKA